jgi:periplasmic protein TonB
MISKIKGKRYFPLLLLSVTVALLGAGAFGLVRGILSGAPGQPKKVVQEIHVIRPPPPPPDQPPPPPPPPEEKVDVPDPQKQEPDPTPSNEPPPSEQLGLDAEGTAGGDAFGLVGNKGGRELIATGGGSVFAWYAGLVKGEILEQLSENQELRRGSYKAAVQIWIRPDGGVDHARVVKSSGDPKRDRSIVSALERLRISKPPPSDFPQSMTFEMDGHG